MMGNRCHPIVVIDNMRESSNDATMGCNPLGIGASMVSLHIGTETHAREGVHERVKVGNIGRRGRARTALSVMLRVWLIVGILVRHIADVFCNVEMIGSY